MQPLEMYMKTMNSNLSTFSQFLITFYYTQALAHSLIYSVIHSFIYLTNIYGTSTLCLAMGDMLSAQGELNWQSPDPLGLSLTKKGL